MQYIVEANIAFDKDLFDMIDFIAYDRYNLSNYYQNCATNVRKCKNTFYLSIQIHQVPALFQYVIDMNSVTNNMPTFPLVEQ